MKEKKEKNEAYPVTDNTVVERAGGPSFPEMARKDPEMKQGLHTCLAQRREGGNKPENVPPARRTAAESDSARE